MSVRASPLAEAVRARRLRLGLRQEELAELAGCSTRFVHTVEAGNLTCSGDAHAKNFSVRQSPDGEWGATPAYDVPSSHLYGDHSMALSVNGKTREDIGRADFMALGAFLGLPNRATARVLDALADAAPPWLARLDELPFDTRKVHQLRRAATFRRDRLGPSKG